MQPFQLDATPHPLRLDEAYIEHLVRMSVEIPSERDVRQKQGKQPGILLTILSLRPSIGDQLLGTRIGLFFTVEKWATKGHCGECAR